MSSPAQPTQREIEEHCVLHWPYRDWCPDCVMGRGRDAPHRSKVCTAPMVVMDYGFLSGRDRATDEGEAAPILVARERLSGATLSMVVPQKGDGTGWVNRRVAQWVDDLGHPSIVMRTDGEAAIKALMGAVRLCREVGSQTILENSPPGDSKANGAAERAVGEVKGLIRTLRVALDRRLNCTLPETHPIFTFLIEYAGVLISKFKVWDHGKTAWEFLRGRRCSTPVCEFGEKVIFLPAKTVASRDWQYGVYVGMMRKTNEFLVAGEDGAVVKARSIKRLSLSNRWSKEWVDRIKGTPWAPVDGVREKEVPAHIAVPRLAADAIVPPAPDVPDAADKQIRRMRIPKDAYLRHGSSTCKGCRLLRSGRSNTVQHSLECVRQVEQALMQDKEWATKIEQAYERQTERMARKLEAQIEREERAKRMKTEEAPAAPATSAAAPPAPPAAEAQGATASDMTVDSGDSGGASSSNNNGDSGSSNSGGGAKARAAEESDAGPAKRQRIQVLDARRMSPADEADRRSLRAAIGGGVNVIMAMDVQPTANDERDLIKSRIWADIYKELMAEGGFFAHIHAHADKPIMEMQNSTSLHLKNGMKVTTNSDKIVRKAGRLNKVDTEGRMSAEEIFESIKTFVQGQHVQPKCNIFQHEMDWSKMRDVRQICSMIHCQDQVWDDVRGGWLPIEEVKKARLEELKYVREAPLFKKVPRTVPHDKGMPIIPIKWVDTNKGTDTEPLYRSRVVAMEFKKASVDKSGDHELFAPMPPIEALRLVVSHAATSTASGKRRGILIADVRRAYFCAKARRPIYVEIPVEDWEDGDDTRCAELIQSMYGTRDAARNWSEELRKVMIDMGAIPGLASPSTFVLERNGRLTKIVIHGDDIVAAGEDEDLAYIQGKLEKRFSMKVERVGTMNGYKDKAKILNRLIGVDKHGFYLEADPRHIQELKKELNMETIKGANTPIDDTVLDTAATGELLEAKDARKFRGAAARLNYLAIDRPDLRVTAVAASRMMASPTSGAWAIIRRCVRYLTTHPRWRARYCWQDPVKVLTCYTDSDWGRDRITRQSTSGGVIMAGRHFLKAWCKTQHAVALSSMEAELYACVLGSVEVKGAQSIMRDMRDPVDVQVWIDSSAALGFIQREGLAKTKHAETQWLWVQRQVREGKLMVGKVDTAENPADVLTKPLVGSKIEKFMEAMEFVKVP